jgi:hypothetical protein
MAETMRALFSVLLGSLVLVTGVHATTSNAKGADSRPTPMDKDNASGVWEGLQVGSEGDIVLARLSVEGQTAALSLCVFDGGQVEPLCEQVDFSRLQIFAGGRLKGEAPSKSGTDIWKRVRLSARGTADPGFGRMDVVVTFFDNRGHSQAVWNLALYRGHESLLETIHKHLERFRSRYPQ